MAEFKTITEHEILFIVWGELLQRIYDEEKKNERFFAENKRQNGICLNRIKMYNEQLIEIQERIIEIEHENKT